MRTRIAILMAEMQVRENRTINNRIVAEETGLSPATVSKWINNDLDRFEDTTLVKLCRYFHCTLQDLIFIDENAPDKIPSNKRGKGQR